MAIAKPSIRGSNRFCAPFQRLPTHRLTGRPYGVCGGALFPDGAWAAIKIRLETCGWSPMQIELIHGHLRQGWPLTMAVRQAALVTGLCPLRSRPLG